MRSLLLAALKVAFLLVMWLFIIFIANVVRTDLFGRRVNAAELAAISDSTTVPASSLEQRRQTPALTTLVITSGQAQGRRIGLPTMGGKELIIGRGSRCDFNIDDTYASGEHAKLWCDVEGYVVEDLLSTNGTYVNGQKIQHPTRVGAHDVIRVGRSQLRLEA